MYQTIDKKNQPSVKALLHYFDRSLQNYLLTEMPVSEEREQFLHSLRQVAVKIIHTTEVEGFHVYVLAFCKKIQYPKDF